MTVLSEVPGLAQKTGRVPASIGISIAVAGDPGGGLPSRSAAITLPSSSSLKRVVLRRSSHTQPSASRSSSWQAAHHVPGGQHRERVHIGDEVAHIVVGRPQHDVLRRAATARCARPP